MIQIMVQIMNQNKQLKVVSWHELKMILLIT
jgi:hypothetical protein